MARHGRPFLGRSLSFGIIVVGFATACGPVDENRSQTVEVDAILELDNEVHTAVEAQDIEGLMEFWADDALIMAPSMPAVEGKSAVRVFFENAFSAMSLEFDRSSVEVVVSGDLAIHRGHTVAGLDGGDRRRLGELRRGTPGSFSTPSTVLRRCGDSSRSTSPSTMKRFRVRFSAAVHPTRSTSVGRRIYWSASPNIARERSVSGARQIEQRVAIAAKGHALALY